VLYHRLPSAVGNRVCRIHVFNTCNVNSTRNSRPRPKARARVWPRGGGRVSNSFEKIMEVVLYEQTVSSVTTSFLAKKASD
jgi:hypothetical protein